MNILINGSGAVGLGLGASMLSQKTDVSFYATGKTAAAIKENGLERTGLFQHYSFTPDEYQVYEDYKDIPEKTFDYVFICSKTVANDDISRKLAENKEILKDNCKIIIFQNGFANDEPFLRYFSEDEVYCARVITGFSRPQRHISEITVYTEPILLGSLQNADPECLEKIAQMISASGIKCETTTEIDKYLWAKMLYNCALNPLGVILNCTYGKLTENEYSKNIMDSIIDEIFAVIKKSEYSTLWDSADEYRKLFYSKLVPDTYNHYSSTYQDIQKKIKTEIDTLNGTVIRLGEKYGVDVSTNKIIYNLIKSIESEF